MHIKSKSFQTRNDDCKIRPTNFERLDLVKELLGLLNDPYVGPYKLAETITHIPVFAARCRREAALFRPRSEVEDIERALNVIGNRGIEKVLLELLEDMTILRAEPRWSRGQVIYWSPSLLRHARQVPSRCRNNPKIPSKTKLDRLVSAGPILAYQCSAHAFGHQQCPG